MNHEAIVVEQLTVELHALIRDGRGDEKEADEVREKLAESLLQLPEDQRRLLNELSGDLYLIDGVETLVPPGERTVGDLKVAWDARDWRRLRDLLVFDFPEVNSTYRAYLRGRTWGELGYFRAAAEFLSFAWRTAPERDNYGYLALEALLQSHAFEEAWHQAARILANSSSSATLLYKVADILYAGAARSDDAFRPRLYDRVVEVVEKAIGLPQPSLSSLRTSALVKKAFAAANLGELDAADATLTTALHHDRDNDFFFAARGFSSP